MGTRKYH